MKFVTMLLVSLVVVLLSSLPVFAQVGSTTADNPVNDPQYGAVTVGKSPVLPGGTPVPAPVTEPVIVSTGRFEFVGTTTQLMQGDRGVLNFTLACQSEFEGSRICRVEEVLSTVNVPRFTIETKAWIVPDQSIGAAFRADCNGWMSQESGDSGLAVIVGPDVDCSGGFKTSSCNSQLAVACCMRR